MDHSVDDQTQHRQRVQLLKREIQQLCQKLQEEGEETLVLMTNRLRPDLECSMQGSNAGLKFVQSQQGVVTNFVKYFQKHGEEEQVTSIKPEDKAKSKDQNSQIKNTAIKVEPVQLKPSASTSEQYQEPKVLIDNIIQNRHVDSENSDDNNYDDGDDDNVNDLMNLSVETNDSKKSIVVKESKAAPSNSVRQKPASTIQTRSHSKRRTRKIPKRYADGYIKTRNALILKQEKEDVDETDKTWQPSSNVNEELSKKKTKKSASSEKTTVVKDHETLKNYTSEKENVCKTCGKKFKNKNLLQSHSKTHTLETSQPNKPTSKPLECFLCTKAFSGRAKLRDHMKTHSVNGCYECLTCKKMFKKLYHLRAHVGRNCEPKKQVTYDCPKCGFKFRHRSHLKDHLEKRKKACTDRITTTMIFQTRDTDQEIVYTDKTTEEIKTITLNELAEQGKSEKKCLICLKTFRHSYNFHRHILKYTNDKPYKCDLCPKKFRIAEGMKRHRSIHFQKPFDCDGCSRRYETQEKLDYHKMYKCVTGEKPHLKCQLCGHKSASNFALEVHIRSHAGVKEFECDICQKKLASKESVERHKKVYHQEECPFSCEVCGKSFKLKDTLKKHQKIHEEPKYECEVCGKKCTEIGNLKKHMVCHTKEKPFICETCGKAYSRRALLENHQRVHSGERPFSCDECGKNFRSYGNLKQHKNTHSLFHNHICDICGKTFKQRGRMNHHRKGHFIIDRWPCEYCDQKFRSVFMYKNHLAKKHPEMKGDIEHKTNIKLYQCELCDKIYGDKEDLTRHIYIHKGIKPYSCQYCGRAFNDKSNMRQHEKIHTNERKHSCPVCYKAFIHNRTLTIHMKVHKKDEIHFAVKRQEEMQPEQHQVDETIVEEQETECKEAIECVLQNDTIIPEIHVPPVVSTQEISMIGATIVSLSDLVHMPNLTE
ncbi:hypothetical protein ACJMK2_034498 [Sinanodonta woodiana]|uniref:C2H2-type domain-containing protein n=1 Tax=Sinanodonta woodiana TaxID=1069815 RepID=A0ABD3WRT8_SINWO